jgi:Putative transposase DNA-binding domain
MAGSARTVRRRVLGAPCRMAVGAARSLGLLTPANRPSRRAPDAIRWFEESLRSVSRYTGPQVIKVPAAFTSLRCSVCGHVDPKSRESQAGFRCTSCSRRQHADVNAAKNVLAAGLAVTACREAAPPPGGATTSTQEPAGNREELLLQPV